MYSAVHSSLCTSLVHVQRTLSTSNVVLHPHVFFRACSGTMAHVQECDDGKPSHGVCVLGAAGRCSCNEGYEGDKCDSCAPGFQKSWTRDGEACMRIVDDCGYCPPHWPAEKCGASFDACAQLVTMYNEFGHAVVHCLEGAVLLFRTYTVAVHPRSDSHALARADCCRSGVMASTGECCPLADDALRVPVLNLDGSCCSAGYLVSYRLLSFSVISVSVVAPAHEAVLLTRAPANHGCLLARPSATVIVTLQPN